MPGMDAVRRFLELVARELGADDARIEIGLRDPADGCPSCELAGGYRLVAIYDAPDPAQTDRRRERLAVLATTFASTLTEGLAATPAIHTGVELAAGALDETLAILASSVDATAAMVVDRDSPMIWGSSLVPRGPEDADVAAWVSTAAATAARHGLELAALLVDPEVDATLERAGLDDEGRGRISRALGRLHGVGLQRSAAQWRAFVVTMRAIAAARRGDEDAIVGFSSAADREAAAAYVCRGFGGIYRAVLAFDHAYSELHAESALRKALPVIERMVISLPPVDPSPGGGRGQVVSLFPPR
jgi:hypothetical protein